MADERDLSQFLYRMTNEIVTSGDYSDCNINRICGKHYESSTYPDKDRLRRLVAELKHKLQISQLIESKKRLDSTERIQHRCDCPYATKAYSPYPVPPADRHETTSCCDKCVGTTQSATFFPSNVRIHNASVQYSDPGSVETYNTGMACHNSTCNSCCSELPLDKHSITTSSQSPRSSEESKTLVEQLLLKHAALDGETSSEILMRMAAGDRVLCEDCSGRCPLHACRDEFHRGEREPREQESSKGTPGSRRVQPPEKVCKCPLKNCQHFERSFSSVGGSGSGGGHRGGRDAPILRQEIAESATPPVRCCGTKKKEAKPGCRSK